MEENKNMEQNNVAANNEEQMNKTPDGHPVEVVAKEGILAKVKKHKGKIGMVLGGVGLVAAGVVADRFGLSKLPFGKKTEDQDTTEAE